MKRNEHREGFVNGMINEKDVIVAWMIHYQLGGRAWPYEF